MTRVSEALARAAQTPSGGAAPLEDGETFPAEAPAEMWPVERAPGQRQDRNFDEPAGDVLTSPEPYRPDPARPAALLPASGTAGSKLVTRPDALPAPVEQYRRLAARLHLAQAESGTRVVMITSAVASEGKTLTATNLALTLSESYKRRVLLIDADLRRPGLHELFGIPNLTGLNDGVRADVDRKVPLIAISDYLSVLTAGRPDPDPMSVLASDRMRRILTDAGKAFDWVVVDTPPVAVLSDAHLLARLVDTVVLVVKAASTQHAAMTRAIDAVGRDRILGVVLNCTDPGRHLAYQYYGYAATGDPAGV